MFHAVSAIFRPYNGEPCNRTLTTNTMKIFITSYLFYPEFIDYFTCERKCSVIIDEFNTCRHSNSWITVHLTIGGKMYTYDVCLHSTVYLDVSINCSAWEIGKILELCFSLCKKKDICYQIIYQKRKL